GNECATAVAQKRGGLGIVFCVGEERLEHASVGATVAPWSVSSPDASATATARSQSRSAPPRPERPARLRRQPAPQAAALPPSARGSGRGHTPKRARDRSSGGAQLRP